MQKEKLEDHKEFLLSALLTIVVGKSGNCLSNQTTHSCLVRFLNAFFTDEQILSRYNEAIDGGLGSLAWQDMPTLKDFYTFCTLENLGTKFAQGDIKQALQQIQLSLEPWAKTRVGNTNNEPNPFRTDAQLLVFALKN